ncbi:MAG: hypothetical protein Q4C70_06910 [Planctomycetia bacterium]|nr:hypothetical protein [Planctomycetia bacterium]
MYTISNDDCVSVSFYSLKVGNGRRNGYGIVPKWCILYPTHEEI